MYEEANSSEAGSEQGGEAAPAAKVRKPRAKKAPEVKEKVEEISAQRLGIELDDAVSTEIDQLCASNRFLQRSTVRAIVRETARQAANEAVSGKVRSIILQQFGGGQ